MESAPSNNLCNGDIGGFRHIRDSNSTTLAASCHQLCIISKVGIGIMWTLCGHSSFIGHLHLRGARQGLYLRMDTKRRCVLRRDNLVVGS
jgi:hypothetical protein